MANLRTSPEVMSALNRRADRIAQRAGPGHVVVDSTIESGAARRGRVRIIAATREARRANAHRNALLRALGGGGG